MRAFSLTSRITQRDGETGTRTRVLRPGGIQASRRQAYSQGAILQPPKPEIIPSERILQPAAEHDTEPGHEAAD